ncbi:hypothetical protein L7F22_059925 [Adiantum nelumboides]|nr:hypothetical protein [Adiantum nelumboides]
MLCFYRRNLLTTIARVQSGMPSKLEQIAGVNGIYPVESLFGARALYFRRPFSVGTQTLSLNYEIPQSKLSGVLADTEETFWNADVDKYLSGLCNETTLPLVHEAMEIMQPSSAKEVLKVAATAQQVPTFSRYLYNKLFRAFLHAGRFNRAVEVLEGMKKSGIPVNSKSFSTLVFFYLKAGMKAEAEETLDTMKSFGITPKQDVYAVLLREYAAAGDEESMERVLQRCSNSGDLDCALQVFAELGKPAYALKLLTRMEAAGIVPHRGTVLTVTTCLCNANMIDEALKQAMKVQEKGLFLGAKVFNTLILSLVGEKRLDEALKLVSKMKDAGCKPNILTHHHLISGYLNTGQTDLALMHLEEMKGDGCRPTLVTMKLFEGILDKTVHTQALGEVEDIKEETHMKVAKRILGLCEEKMWNADIEEALSGYSKDLTDKVVKKVLRKLDIANIKDFFTWAGNQTGYSHGRHEYRALIRRFLYAGMFDSAMEFVEEMWEKDLKVVSNDFATLVYHSGKAGRMAEAEAAIDKMKFFGLNPDATLYGAALSGHIEANDDEGVASVLQKLSNVEEFNAAISAFARAKKADSALSMLKAMEEKGCDANVMTYDLLVRCLCIAERTEEAIEVFENMLAKGLAPNLNIFNVLISHCCRHNLETALKLFSQMKGNGCQPDIVTHNSLISGYLKSRQVERAHQHVELMKAEGCKPTRETSRLFVVRLSMTEELDKALEEFEKAAECGKILPIDACNCLLKGLTRAGKMEAALKVYEIMKGDADASTYVVMLRGCCNLSKFDVIEQLLADARMKKLQIPVSTYVCLLQTYSRANINKKVASIFQEFQNSGLSLDVARTNTAVLDALSRGCQLDVGVKFCKQLADHSAKINVRQLKRFFRLLVRSGRAGEATELSKELTERGCVIPEKSAMQAA